MDVSFSIKVIYYGSSESAIFHITSTDDLYLVLEMHLYWVLAIEITTMVLIIIGTYFKTGNDIMCSVCYRVLDVGDV